MNPEPELPELPIRNRQGIPGPKAVFWFIIALIVMIALLTLVAFLAVRQVESTTEGFAAIEYPRPLEIDRG